MRKMPYNYEKGMKVVFPDTPECLESLRNKQVTICEVGSRYLRFIEYPFITWIDDGVNDVPVPASEVQNKPKEASDTITLSLTLPEGTDSLVGQFKASNGHKYFIDARRVRD